MAMKFFYDKTYKNMFYSKVGGIPLKELNDMEIEFLTLIDYNICVSTDNYNQFYDEWNQKF